MRRIVICLACLVFVVSACGSDKKAASPATTTSAASTSTTEPAATTTSVSVSATSIGVTTTTASECPDIGSSGPRSTPALQPAALLTQVSVANAQCRDSVTFTFRKKDAKVPSCKVEYQPGPFTHDGSGAPVTVAGTAFAVVRCEPAYGNDFEHNGDPTYTGPKRIVATGTKHVREVVETGDFEGVVSWVIGLDAKRGFGITSGGTPDRQLIITFS